MSPILGFHFIFSAYGFWLPNDPRGSWSDVVRAFHLLKFGPATKVETTRSLASDPHDRRLRFEAKRSLHYPPVRFDGPQARAIARGFGEAAREGNYTLHALAILPDHAHLVVAWHPRHLDEIASHLKAKATRRLSMEGLHPMDRFASPDGRKPSPWARNHWCPFLMDLRHLRTAIRYVEANPIKAGLRRQRWKCVAPLVTRKV